MLICVIHVYGFLFVTCFFGQTNPSLPVTPHLPGTPRLTGSPALSVSPARSVRAVLWVFICGFAASEADPTWIEQIEQQLSRGPDDVLEELGKKLRTLKMPQIGVALCAVLSAVLSAVQYAVVSAVQYAVVSAA